jgi:DNA replication protein DnaC
VIIDDFGMRKLSATEAQDLCELLEERSIGNSRLFTTQLPLDHWSEVIPIQSSPMPSEIGSSTQRLPCTLPARVI